MRHLVIRYMSTNIPVECAASIFRIKRNSYASTMSMEATLSSESWCVSPNAAYHKPEDLNLRKEKRPGHAITTHIHRFPKTEEEWCMSPQEGPCGQRTVASVLQEQAFRWLMQHEGGWWQNFCWSKRWQRVSGSGTIEGCRFRHGQRCVRSDTDTSVSVSGTDRGVLGSSINAACQVQALVERCFRHWGGVRFKHWHLCQVQAVIPSSNTTTHVNKQDRQCTYNVILRRVRVTIIAVLKH
jgi:hypothetical protein